MDYLLSKKHSPFLILKTADLNTVTKWFVKCVQDTETFWIPNAVYIEESVCKKFVDLLKYAIDQRNRDVILSSVRRERVNALVSQKSRNGNEVMTLHNRFRSCYIVVNSDFSSLSLTPNESHDQDGRRLDRFVSIEPLPNDTACVSEMNKHKGICASIWTNDALQINSIPMALKYYRVWVNCVGLYDSQIPLPDPELWESTVWKNRVDSAYLYWYKKKPVSKLEKVTLSEILSQCSRTLESTCTDDFLTSIDKTARTMKNNWTTGIHFERIFDRTPEFIWNSCIDYLEFWSSSKHRLIQSFPSKPQHIHKCLVKSTNEPVGVIAILAGSMLMNKLFFYIAAAVAHGNVVLVGLPTDEPSSVIACKLEKLFLRGLVTVLMDTRNELWRQFRTCSLIASVWIYTNENFSEMSLARVVDHQTIYSLSSYFDCEKEAKRLLPYLYILKSIWLPLNCGPIDDKPTSS